MATATKSKAPSGTGVEPIAAKMRDVMSELKSGLVEREVEIELLARCLIARSNALLIGEPGVAKSLLIREFLTRMTDAKLYEVLLAKDTPTDQVLGPVSLMALEKDEYRRIVTDKLPEAMVAFLDEVFKANSTVLNALLSIINERIFHNNGHSIHVPLWSVVGASNELPGADRDDLRAFRDRFAVTKIVQHVRTSDGLKRVIAGQVERARGEASTEPTLIDRAEVEQLQAAALQVDIPANVMKALTELHARADSENLTISVRRLGEGVKLMQAAAVLSDRTEVSTEDLRVFEHVLWSDPEDAPKAYELTLDYAGAVSKKAAKLRGEFEEQQAALNDIQSNMPTDESVPSSELMGDVGRVSAMMKKLADRTQSAIEDAHDEGHDTADLDAVASDIEQSRESIKKLLGIG